MTSWMHQAIHQSQKPKESLIQTLIDNLSGTKMDRGRDVLHASDITKPAFCPRQWALLDLQKNYKSTYYINTALEVTFQMGYEAERLLVEEWMGDVTRGDWVCRKCGALKTMSAKPTGWCDPTKKHDWGYRQLRLTVPKYSIECGIDALFKLPSSPRLLMTEVKTLNPTDFETIVTPQPEHRIRTNLYMHLVEHSTWEHKGLVNTHEARVLYISRGYGKMHKDYGEILPFKEYTVTRNDDDLAPFLAKATVMQASRNGEGMPAGICATANDPIAKKCSCVIACFSGSHPATLMWKK